MSEQSFDAFTRRAAAAIWRRRSLLTLAGAALAAKIAAPATTSAKPSAKKKAKRKCRRQTNQCKSILLALDDADPELIAAVLPCCGCNVPQFLNCFLPLAN